MAPNGKMRAETSVFGTDEPRPKVLDVTAGPVTAKIIDGSARMIAWNGVEVVRGIDCPIRDENWGTSLTDDVRESVEERDGKTVFTRDFTALDGSLSCTVAYVFDPAGSVEARFEATAGKDVLTNRSGFTVLHPILGVAGTPLTISHSDGSSEASEFPLMVKPSQPAFDITGLTHQIGEAEIRLTFGGEIFEMEDQRNWSDASYKTYCRPLSRPLPYTIAKGEVVRQTIRIDVSDATSAPATSAADATGVGGRVPQMLLAVDDGWWPEGDGRALIDLVSAHGVLVRLGAGRTTSPEWIGDMAAGRTVDLEVVVPEGAQPAGHLASLAKDLEQAGVRVAHVTALPEPYLKSYQPDAVWPTGPSPAEAAEAARLAFGDARIGVGMLTNFTELNRCRPDIGQGDFVTHGSSAIVHAADDISVFQTLEALDDIYRTTRSFSNALPCRLGLSAIAMRDNPYGADVAANPDMRRVPMARSDPRHSALFGAAFAVGVAAASARAGCEAVALAAPVGPFGVADTTGEEPTAYPIFHVVRALASLAGSTVVNADLPAGVHGIAADIGGRRAMIAANCRFEDAVLSTEGVSRVLVLDESTVDAARNPRWLNQAATTETDGDVRLAPCSIAFVNLEPRA